MPGGFVLVDDTFGNHRVDNRYRGFVGLGGNILVTFFDGSDDRLDMRAHLRAKLHIVESRFGRLAGTFLC